MIRRPPRSTLFPYPTLVLDLAREEPADRLQTGVRVRRNVHPAGAGDVVRSVVVGEAPRTDQGTGPLWEGAADRHRPRTAERHRPAGDHLDAAHTPTLAHVRSSRNDIGSCARSDRLRREDRRSWPVPGAVRLLPRARRGATRR